MPPLEDDDIDMNEGLSEPGKPTGVEVADFDATSATLKWKAPEEDGGAPVKEYLVSLNLVPFDKFWNNLQIIAIAFEHQL